MNKTDILQMFDWNPNKIKLLPKCSCNTLEKKDAFELKERNKEFKEYVELFDEYLYSYTSCIKFIGFYLYNTNKDAHADFLSDCKGGGFKCSKALHYLQKALPKSLMETE